MHFGGGAFFEEHGDDVGSRSIAEELALGGAVVRMLFVVGDSMFFDELEKVSRSKSSQSRAAKIDVVGEEIVGAATKIREVTAAATGDQNLLAGFIGAFQDDGARTRASGFGGAQESGGASPYYQHVKSYPTTHGLPHIRNLLG
jgi:hypothetical protein